MDAFANKLAQFAQWALNQTWEGYELDSSEVQDKAEELGLTVEVPYDPKVHGETEIEIEPGEPFHVLSDNMKAALAAKGE